MTDTAIIIAVAKLDGFVNIDRLHPAKTEGGYLWIDKNNIIHNAKRVPFYTDSRDAIIPVIEKHFKADWSIGNRFIDELFISHSCSEGSADLTDVYNTSAQVTTALLISTPKQLSIALLKATGKWED